MRIMPWLVAAGACMLCLCITMAEYVNPFYLFPTWDQLFTRAENRALKITADEIIGDSP